MLFAALSSLLDAGPWRKLLLGRADDPALPAPLIATLAMTTLLPAIPTLKRVDEWFLSIFLNRDLGVPAGRELDLWTAAAASVSGLSMAVASPIWGVLGDRFGRKPMLLRSMLGGAITVGLIFFAQNPLQLVLLRFLQGATSGTVAAATSLVAAETPRSRVGWALGVVTSAVALGGAIGPVVGGLAGDLLGLRLVFLFGGIALLLSLPYSEEDVCLEVSGPGDDP